MAAAIGLRGDFDAFALRGAAKRSKDGPQSRFRVVGGPQGAVKTAWI
jgi:hypothetical protein